MAPYLLCACILAIVRAQPEQLHLSYGYDPSQMTVVWSTPDSSSSVVLYGVTPYKLSSNETGVCWEFTEDNPDGLHYVHKVVLKVCRNAYWGIAIYVIICVYVCVCVCVRCMCAHVYIGPHSRNRVLVCSSERQQH